METKAGLREEFVRALASFPDWAIQRAFDVWVRSMTRRPSPGEIVILVGREMEPITREIESRRRHAESAQSHYREPPDPETAKRILEQAGFTPQRMEAMKRAPMAVTFADAENIAAAPARPHWTETADPNGPEIAALKAARAKNQLMNPEGKQ